MEERSPNRPRPSGDWKPYRREESEPEEASEKPKPSGDWRPYERDEESAPQARVAETDRDERAEAKADGGGEAEEKQAPDEEQRTDGDAREERGEQEPSGVDAMGQDKHRKVSGQRYGLSRGRQLLYYGLFVAFVIGAYIGLKAAADTLDKAPAKDPDKAPWSKPDAEGGPLGGFTPSSPNQKGPTDFQ